MRVGDQSRTFRNLARQATLIREETTIVERLDSVAPEIELTPGLPAEVVIITGDRMLLDYLPQPLRETLERSLRGS